MALLILCKSSGDIRYINILPGEELEANAARQPRRQSQQKMWEHPGWKGNRRPPVIRLRD